VLSRSQTRKDGSGISSGHSEDLREFHISIAHRGVHDDVVRDLIDNITKPHDSLTMRFRSGDCTQCTVRCRNLQLNPWKSKNSAISLTAIGDSIHSVRKTPHFTDAIDSCCSLEASDFDGLSGAVRTLCIFKEFCIARTRIPAHHHPGTPIVFRRVDGGVRRDCCRAIAGVFVEFITDLTSSTFLLRRLRKTTHSYCTSLVWL
jgi:hypothetical protein